MTLEKVLLIYAISSPRNSYSFPRLVQGEVDDMDKLDFFINFITFGFLHSVD